MVRISLAKEDQAFDMIGFLLDFEVGQTYSVEDSEEQWARIRDAISKAKLQSALSSVGMVLGVLTILYGLIPDKPKE